MLRLLDEHLDAHDEVILYGHPCYEGVREGVLRKVFAARGRARIPVRHHADDGGAAAGGPRRAMIRVLSVFGTRPEAIKMAPVVRALRRAPDRFESLVCVSAQHRTMLDQVLEVFDLKADIDLDLMVPGQTPAGIAAGILDRLPPLLRRVRPDIVLVQGDTTTTFAAAFAAFSSGSRRGTSRPGSGPAIAGSRFPKR